MDVTAEVKKYRRDNPNCNWTMSVEKTLEMRAKNAEKDNKNIIKRFLSLFKKKKPSVLKWTA